MKVTGVILAAGTSSRMRSQNKLLLKYKNHTIIEEVVKNLLASLSCPFQDSLCPAALVAVREPPLYCVSQFLFALKTRT